MNTPGDEVRLLRLKAPADAREVVEALDRDGAAILVGVLDEGSLAKLRAELTPFLDATPAGRDDFSGRDTRRVGALMARSPMCRELALHPRINEAAARYLARHSDGYQLHFTQAVRIGPGETGQVLHRDRGVWGDALNRSVETQFSTIWAIDDFTAANGATRVVPGSHVWHRERKPEREETVAAEMAAGSVLVYNGSVLHGGGANVSDTSRLGVLLHYTLAWLRQEENQYLSCPPEIAATLPAPLRELIGYSKGGPVLGFFSTPGAPGEGVEVASPTRLFER